LGGQADILLQLFVTRREFEALRDLPDKLIEGDIQFSAPGECSPVLIFENIRVQNSLGYDLRVNGKFNPLLPSVTINFRILDVGPICRIEVNSTLHGGSRTHKHSGWRKTRAETCRPRSRHG
jgi:hypothetical protein